MAAYLSDNIYTDQDTTTTDDSTTCDDEGGASTSSDSEADIELLQLVSPKLPITTITKQAEISPTEKFVNIRKLSPGRIGATRKLKGRKPSPLETSKSENLSAINQSTKQSSGTYAPSARKSNTSRDDVITRLEGSNKTHFMSSEEWPSMSTYPSGEATDYGLHQTRTSNNDKLIMDTKRITENHLGQPASQTQDAQSLPKDSAPNTQIYGTRPKKRMMLSLNQNDSSLGVRYVLSHNEQSPQGELEDNSKHRRLLASRVAQLANQVLGFEAADETVSQHTASSTSTQTFHHSYSDNQLLEHSSDAADNSSTITHSQSMIECQPCSSENQSAFDQVTSAKSPEIKSPLVPQSMMADSKFVRREVLTNGSLRKRRQLLHNTPDSNKPAPMLAYIPTATNLPEQSRVFVEQSTDRVETTDQNSEQRQPLLIDNDDRIESHAQHRPDSLDIPSAASCQTLTLKASSILAQSLITGSLISGEGTPTQTPSDSGLVNPGFVFEFSGSPSSGLTEDSVFGTTKPASSPSLLDVLHKKYWANNSPSSTLTRQKSKQEPMSTSVFRSRHESYCRVVDQNLNEELSFQTLPIMHSSKPVTDTSDPSAIRMFGDVSLMFNTLPARGHEERKRTSSMSERVSGGREVERSESADKLTVPNQSQISTPTTGSQVKLTRKFSLSPKVLRRKIIARLQPGSSDQSEKSQSTESVAEDWLLAKFRKDGPQNRRKELEIEAVEACSWLQQAGFAQYVQLFEDNQFPVDLQAVETDHSFLDHLLLESLFRRLTTLNKSVHMKLDINNKKPLYGSGLEEDDDDGTCVLSDKWTYERESGRWSHIDTVTTTAASGGGVQQNTQRMRSCSSRDSVMTDDTTGEETGDSASPLLQSKNNNNTSHTVSRNQGNNTTGPKVKISLPLTAAASEVSSNHSERSYDISLKGQQTLEKKRNGGSFFQRAASLTRKSSRKTRDNKFHTSGALTISGPTIVNTPDMDERMQRLGCVEIIPNLQQQKEDVYNNNTMSGKPLLRSASTEDASYYCDRCSVDTTITEYLLPEDYVLGTFPKELVETKIPSRNNSISSRTLTRNNNTTTTTTTTRDNQQQCSHKQSTFTLRTPTDPHITTAGNRLSVYDNIPLDSEEEKTPVPPLISPPHTEKETAVAARQELDAVLHDLLININNLDLDADDSTSLSDIFSYNQTTSSTLKTQHSDSGSSQNLQTDSAIVSPTSEELSSLPATPGAPSTPREPTSSLTEQVDRLESSEELTGADLEVDEAEEGLDGELRETIWRERRDSGVGSSLTREPLERKKKVRLRWHSFVASHRPSFNSQNLHISSLSAGQLMYLKRLSLLKVTSLMEQYSPSHKSGFSLQLVNRFMKKGSRTPDYNEKQVFGVPLSVILQRSGQPLPQCILHAMRFLRKSAPDSVGIFRKSGVKSRIQKLRNDLEQDPDNVTQFDSAQAYDVADMFKQYLRELPECLVTTKLSDTFLAIYQHVPQELRLEALQSCVLLLPDENREVLESLLYFLSDMASYHEENQMTSSNLAMCFAPSLFNIHNRAQSKSPKSDRKNIGLPEQREFMEQRSATDCLTSMIIDCKKVFRISEDFLTKCSSSSSYMEAGEPAPLSLLGAGPDYQTHIESCIQGLLKQESKEKGWVASSAHSNESIDISYKKVHDGNPLRLWKCSTEIEAPPTEILNRVLNERQKWDEDYSKWRVVEKLDTQLDVFQYVCNSMAPQPSREYITLRAWKKDLPKGACALVMHSIDHEANSLGGGIRGIILASHYLIEPTGAGKSKLTHISRIDSRGRQAKWYNKSYGIIAASNLLKVKESFTKALNVNVHETKV